MRQGRHCECYRDGKLVIRFDDIHPNDLHGQVSLYSHGAFRFRNIRVTDPTGKVPFDGLPKSPAIKTKARLLRLRRLARTLLAGSVWKGTLFFRNPPAARHHDLGLRLARGPSQAQQ